MGIEPTLDRTPCLSREFTGLRRLGYQDPRRKGPTPSWSLAATRMTKTLETSSSTPGTAVKLRPLLSSVDSLADVEGKTGGVGRQVG
jgi:hypothetical protein